MYRSLSAGEAEEGLLSPLHLQDLSGSLGPVELQQFITNVHQAMQLQGREKQTKPPKEDIYETPQAASGPTAKPKPHACMHAFMHAAALEQPALLLVLLLLLLPVEMALLRAVAAVDLVFRVAAAVWGVAAAY